MFVQWYCYDDDITLFAITQMEQQFCYWDAKSLEDTIILIVFFLIEMGIAVFTVMRLRKTSRLGEHGKKIILIYILIIAWATIICSQQFYSIFIYFNYLKDDVTNVSYYSKNFVRFDILPGFIVQTIFLIICRFYYKGLMGAIEISHLQKWEQKFIIYLNIYLIVRLVSQSIGLTLVNIYAETDLISVFSSVNIWILISDSVITNAYLGLSLKIYLKRLNHIISMQKKELIKLKIQYSIMIFSSFFRVAIDILFLTALPQVFSSSPKDGCMGPFDSHLVQSIFYLIIGNTVNHVIPIIWILKIYTFYINTNLLTTAEECSTPSDNH